MSREALRAFWCSAVIYTGRAQALFMRDSGGRFSRAVNAMFESETSQFHWKPVQTSRPGGTIRAVCERGSRAVDFDLGASRAADKTIYSRQYPLRAETALPKSSSNRLRLADHEKRIHLDGRTTYRTPGLAEQDSCQLAYRAHEQPPPPPRRPQGTSAIAKPTKEGVQKALGTFFPPGRSRLPR